MSVFKLFANIIPVKGAKRATLCDLLRGRIKLIPIDLFDLLERYPNHSPDEVIADHPEHAEVIKSYFDALLEDHWGFLCDEPEAFPALDLSYDAPARINNGIIDVDHTSNHDYKNLITQLNQLGCNFLQVRIYDSTSMDELTQILEATKGSRIRGLEIFVRYQNDLDEEDYLMLMQQYRRLYSLVIHDAPLDKAIKARDSWGDLRFQRLRLEGSSACGVISKQDFVSELSVFTEGLSHNSCLNRKLSVDTRGFIRNCPSMSAGFGHTSDTTLEEALETPGFQAMWDVTKDQVAVCKDCEFRYVCTDCRAYTQDGDPLGKPEKCQYDPYEATWAEHPVMMVV